MSVDERTGVTTASKRWPRRLAVGSATMGLLAVASTAAGGWYYSNELLLVRPEPQEYPVEVVAVTASAVTLAGEGADQPGVIGLEWPGGYARVGPPIDVVDGQVRRPLIPYPDVPDLGTRVHMDFYAAPTDVADFTASSGIEAVEVHYDGPLGRYPATFVPRRGGDQTRWVIHVHGRGGTRGEGYRLVPAIHELGYQQLSIAYRNDDDAPADPDGEFGLGWTESEDLAAAIAYARRRGARDVVLVGYSMGGAVIGNYLRTHGSAGVAGIVYDSPALSWPDILAYQAEDRGLPGFTGAVASAAVRLRTGIRLDAMDQVERAEELDVPVLLAHGTADTTVPVASSDALAAARPDLVTYLRTAAEHVQSWNVDPAGYEHALTEFLRALP